MADTLQTPIQVAQQEAQTTQEGYIHRVLVAFDQFWNVAATDGLPDETISAHDRRVVDDPTAKHKLLAKVLNHMLDAIQPNHGAKAEAGDLQGFDGGRCRRAGIAGAKVDGTDRLNFYNKAWRPRQA